MNRAWTCRTAVCVALAPLMTIAIGRDAASWASAFSRAYNAVDVAAINRLVGPGERQQCIEALARFRERGQRPELTVHVTRDFEEGAYHVVDALTSLRVDGKYEFRDLRVLYYLEKTEEGFRAARTRTPKHETLNEELRIAGKLGEALAEAVDRGDWEAAVGYLSLTPDAAPKLTSQDGNAFADVGLAWLFDALSREEMTVRYRGGSRKRKGVMVRFELVKNGKPAGVHELLLTEASDRARGNNSHGLRALNAGRGPQPMRGLVVHFWSAALVAERFAAVEPAGTGPRTPGGAVSVIPKRATVAGWVDEGGKDVGQSIEIPRNQGIKMRLPGQYVVPLTRRGDKYEFVAGHYSVPQVEEPALPAYREAIAEWRATPGADRPAFLLDILRNAALAGLHADAVNCLNYLRVLRGLLADKENRRTFERCFSAENSARETKNAILSAVGVAGSTALSDMRELFQAALLDPEVSQTAASYYARHDQQAFAQLVLAWLDDEARRSTALGIAKYAKATPAIAHRITALLRAGKIKDTRSCVPFLLAFGNDDGMRYANSLLRKSGGSQDAMLLLRRLATTPDARFTPAVHACVERFRKGTAMESEIIVIQGLAALCAARDPEGIRMTRDYLKATGDDKGRQQLLLMAVSMAAKKQLATARECSDWLKSL